LAPRKPANTGGFGDIEIYFFKNIESSPAAESFWIFRIFMESFSAAESFWIFRIFMESFSAART